MVTRNHSDGGKKSSSAAFSPEPPRKRATPRKWTKQEDTILRRFYPKQGSRYVAELIGRSMSSVQERALRLGVPATMNRRWTEAEISFLKKNYGRRTAGQIARTLKRTEQSVRGQIHILGLGEYMPEQWTEDEVSYLRAHYGKVKVAELAEELGRSRDAVELKASKLGLGRKVIKLTPEQLAWAKSQFGTLSYPKIAEQLGVPLSKISKLAGKHGHRPRSHMRAWTEEEDQYIREHYPADTQRAIAAALDRTVPMITWRVGKLGLCDERRDLSLMRRWTAQEDEELRKLFGEISYREIGEKLGRTATAIAGRVASLKLKREEKESGLV